MKKKTIIEKQKFGLSGDWILPFAGELSHFIPLVFHQSILGTLVQNAILHS